MTTVTTKVRRSPVIKTRSTNRPRRTRRTITSTLRRAGLSPIAQRLLMEENPEDMDHEVAKAMVLAAQRVVESRKRKLRKAIRALVKEHRLEGLSIKQLFE